MHTYIVVWRYCIGQSQQVDVNCVYEYVMCMLSMFSERCAHNGEQLPRSQTT